MYRVEVNNVNIYQLYRIQEVNILYLTWLDMCQPVIFFYNENIHNYTIT